MSNTPAPDTRLAAAPIVTRDALRRPLHDLRISLLDRCNFRCPYCMPASEYHDDYQFLKRPDRLTHDEILLIARAAVGLGVSKLRLTGASLCWTASCRLSWRDWQNCRASTTWR